VQVADNARKAAAEKQEDAPARMAAKQHLMQDDAAGGVAESLDVDSGDVDERRTFHYFNDYAHRSLDYVGPPPPPVTYCGDLSGVFPTLK
jgi:hypothetical protein